MNGCRKRNRISIAGIRAREDLTVTIEITDDGQWLLDVYDKLYDPDTNLTTWLRFGEILLENEKKYLQSSNRQPGYQVGKKGVDENALQNMRARALNKRKSNNGQC